jgi:hypothetical protein
VGRFGRWAVAVLATATAFLLPAWICGALVLPSMLKDPSIRWGLASALGAALAALAAAWGYGFATRVKDPEHPNRMVLAPGVRAAVVGGSNRGSISTGDTAAPRQPSAQGAAQKSATPQPPTAQAASTVTASGERSIAVGGDNEGLLSTGDQQDIAPS